METMLGHSCPKGLAIAIAKNIEPRKGAGLDDFVCSGMRCSPKLEEASHLPLPPNTNVTQIKKMEMANSNCACE
jgi:hypothetical protein